MILEILAMIFLGYLFVGGLLWVIPFDCGGYTRCGFEDYNIFFIAFWLIAPFNENVMRFIEK